jgi:hypothetical protein
MQCIIGHTGLQSSTGTEFFDKWSHIVVTYEGGAVYSSTNKLSFYINGAADTTATITNASTISGDATIGNHTLTAFNQFDGYLADVSIWSVALNASQIRALYLAKDGMYRRMLKDDRLVAALRQMNTGSYPTIDPTEKRATHGFYFGKNAGSITYGDE